MKIRFEWCPSWYWGWSRNGDGKRVLDIGPLAVYFG